MEVFNLIYQTREDWFNAFIGKAREQFEAVGSPLPNNIRVAVGFTSKGSRGRRIGECWSDVCSEDGQFEIFIKPTLDSAARICDVLTHELVHVACGLEAGHNAYFKRVAYSLGLTGKPTATVAGKDWYVWALPVIEALGPLPYGALADGQHTGRKKQKSSLLKVECPECGWLARVTAKHIDGHDHLTCAVPDCGGILQVEY